MAEERRWRIVTDSSGSHLSQKQREGEGEQAAELKAMPSVCFDGDE